MTPPSIRDLEGEDPYELLGIAPTAGSAEIEAAYLRQIRLAHPDLPTGDAWRARLLTVARDILRDPQRRAEWDAGQDRAVEVDLVDIELDQAPSAWDSEDVQDGAGSSPFAYPPVRPQPTGAPPAWYPPPYPPPVYHPPPNYHPYPPPPVPVPAQNGTARTSLVLGIVAIPASVCGLGGVIVGLIAVFLGIAGVRKVRRGDATNQGTAVAGLALGGLAVGLSSLFIIASLIG